MIDETITIKTVLIFVVVLILFIVAIYIKSKKFRFSWLIKIILCLSFLITGLILISTIKEGYIIPAIIGAILSVGSVYYAQISLQSE